MHTIPPQAALDDALKEVALRDNAAGGGGGAGGAALTAAAEAAEASAAEESRVDALQEKVFRIREVGDLVMARSVRACFVN